MPLISVANNNSLHLYAVLVNGTVFFIFAYQDSVLKNNEVSWKLSEVFSHVLKSFRTFLHIFQRNHYSGPKSYHFRLGPNFSIESWPNPLISLDNTIDQSHTSLQLQFCWNSTEGRINQPLKMFGFDDMINMHFQNRMKKTNYFSYSL